MYIYTYFFIYINLLTFLVYLGTTDSNSFYICFNTFNSCPQQVDTCPSFSLISGLSSHSLLYMQPASDTLESILLLCLDHYSSFLGTLCGDAFPSPFGSCHFEPGCLGRTLSSSIPALTPTLRSPFIWTHLHSTKAQLQPWTTIVISNRFICYLTTLHLMLLGFKLLGQRRERKAQRSEDNLKGWLFSSTCGF